jgi:hypothetical protein
MWFDTKARKSKHATADTLWSVTSSDLQTARPLAGCAGDRPIGLPDAVIAGGSLRDLILGREVKDIDIFAQHAQPQHPAHHRV